MVRHSTSHSSLLQLCLRVRHHLQEAYCYTLPASQGAQEKPTTKIEPLSENRCNYTLDMMFNITQTYSNI